MGEADQLERPSKSERAYRTVRAGIGDGTLPSGHRLVVGELAQQLRISPVPVREALRKLEAEGFVTYTRNVGARVANLDAHEYQDTAEALAHLEGIAFCLAAGRLSAAELETCRQINDEMRIKLATFDPRAFVRLDRQFHRLICDRSANRRLGVLIDREAGLLDLLPGATAGVVPGRAQATVDEHAELLELIGRTGDDGQELQIKAREHTMKTLRTTT